MILRWIQPDPKTLRNSNAADSGKTRKLPSSTPASKGSATVSTPKKPSSKIARHHNSGYFDSSLISVLMAPSEAQAASGAKKRTDHRQSQPDHFLDQLGESRFNALLEDLHDTVMPTKTAARSSSASSTNSSANTSSSAQPSAQSASSTTTTESQPPSSSEATPDIPWSAMFLKLGEEMAGSLYEAINQLNEIGLLHPNVKPAIANVKERLEQGRRIALIAQQFAHLRAQPTPEDTELLSLRQVINNALTQRIPWLQRRKIRARLGLMDTHVQANPAALISLVDELIGWAGMLSTDISFALSEPGLSASAANTDGDTPDLANSIPSSSGQMTVTARMNTASIRDDQWQNVGWYLWHQLAKSLNAKAQLQVTQDALSVTVDFAAELPAANLSQEDNDWQEEPDSADTDLSTIVAGCRVVLVCSRPMITDQALQALESLGLQITHCASISQARIQLGLTVVGGNSHPAQWPHAMIYDADLDSTELLDLRDLVSSRSPLRHSVAFVELSDHLGSDVSVSHMGDVSTAHIATAAIRNSLAPTLVFELCKVI